MKEIRDIILIVFACLIPITCFVCSAVLAYNEKPGWGWFILAGVVIAGALKMDFD
jgi:hypothetical protein